MVLTEHLIAAHSADVNTRGGSHATALHAALGQGTFRAASVLLRNLADPDSQTSSCRVPLQVHRVSHGGHLVMEIITEIARLLVNSAAM